MKKTYQVKQPDDFNEIIKDIFTWAADTKKTKLILALEGELGAGKTTFTQELGKYLGVTEKITSPTFTIMSKYDTTNKIFPKLVHIDAYRIESEPELKPLHLDDVFNKEGNIICVEWPSQIKSVIPKDAIYVCISVSDKEHRGVMVFFKK